MTHNRHILICIIFYCFFCTYIYSVKIDIENIKGICEYKTQENQNWNFITDNISFNDNIFIQTYFQSKISFTIDKFWILINDFSYLQITQNNNNTKLLVYYGDLKLNNLSKNFTITTDRFIFNPKVSASIDMFIPLKKKYFFNLISGKGNFYSINNDTNFIISSPQKIVVNDVVPFLTDWDEYEKIKIKKNILLNNPYIETKEEKNIATQINKSISKINLPPKVKSFYPEKDSLVRMEKPYAKVIFNKNMNKKSINNCIFAISDGIKTVRESIKNMIFLNWIKTKWEKDNKILHIYPNPYKLHKGYIYTINLLTNTAVDKYGNKLELDEYTGKFIYVGQNQ